MAHDLLGGFSALQLVLNRVMAQSFRMQLFDAKAVTQFVKHELEAVASQLGKNQRTVFALEGDKHPSVS